MLHKKIDRNGILCYPDLVEQPKPTRDDIRIATINADKCLYFRGGSRCKALVKLDSSSLTAYCIKAGRGISLISGTCPRGRW